LHAKPRHGPGHLSRATSRWQRTVACRTKIFLLLHYRGGEGVGAHVPVEGAGAGEAVGAKLVCGGQARALEHKALGRSKNGDRWHVEAARDGQIFREEKMWAPQHWPLFFWMWARVLVEIAIGLHIKG
jgi:hypothetical protein